MKCMASGLEISASDDMVIYLACILHVTWTRWGMLCHHPLLAVGWSSHRLIAEWITIYGLVAQVRSADCRGGWGRGGVDYTRS